MKEWEAKEARQRAKRNQKPGRRSIASSAPSPTSPAKTDQKAGKNKDEEEDGDEALPPIQDDPAWTVAAVAAKRSDNSLLALIGENILDTLGGLSLNPTQPNSESTAQSDSEPSA